MVQGKSQVAPCVSVVMATHNGARFIEEAVSSVLQQSFKDFEFIIVDDASTDGVDKKIKAFVDSRLYYVRNSEQRKLSASLNRGLALARGEFIARIDDDDRWVGRDKLKKQVALMLADERVGLCGTHNSVIDHEGRELYRIQYPVNDGDIRAQILWRNPFPHASVLICRTALEAVGGGYNEQFFYAQDYELWLRLGLQYTFANVADEYIEQRVNLQSLSNQYQVPQWREFFQSAFHYRHHYPKFYKNMPTYAREFLISSFLTKPTFYRLSAWRQAWKK